MARLREVPFVKGHGTANDFVLLPDLDGKLALADSDVRWLCDRHSGLGADGVLRVVRTAVMPGFEDLADKAEFFMDYRNGDGSIAEMCGNGARVFIRYLDAVGLITESPLCIATRAGVLNARIERDEDGEIQVTVGMGLPTGAATSAEVHADAHMWPAIGLHVPNPHAVAFVAHLDDAGPLREAPAVMPAGTFPEGVNVEFVVERGERHVAMRVHERGVGETMSCGTGACAVAWVARRRLEPQVSGSTTWRVDVPGGTVHVTEDGDGQLWLTGPAALVARGTVLLP